MLIIPARDAETLRSSTTEKLWPAGSWKGTFEDFDIRDLPRNRDGELFKGYVGPAGKRLAITVGDNTPLDGQESVGGQKRFIDIVLEDGPYSLRDTPYEAIPDDAWQLRASARVVANLAAALGQLDVAETPEGEAVVVKDDFLEMLEQGAYKGASIGYVIYHRTGKDKVVRAEIEQFIAA